jgi:hypothetical protein
VLTFAALGPLLFATALRAAPIAPVEAPASSFPADYVHSVSIALAAQPFYASYLLNSFQTQLSAVAALPAAPAAAAYLEKAATAGGVTLAQLRGEIGRDALTPQTASALLIANSLTRPEQFREVMDGLETLKPGLGRHAAAALRAASGHGDGRVLAALRAAGERRPQAEGLTYGPDGRWATLFDGSPAPRGDFDDDAPRVDPNARDASARSRLPVLTKPQ